MHKKYVVTIIRIDMEMLTFIHNINVNMCIFVENSFPQWKFKTGKIYSLKLDLAFVS